MPQTQFTTPEKYSYLNGFGSYHETEAVKGALPIGRNSPQKPPLGLYAEKLSGTAFTAPRVENQQTWLYRILPSAAHSDFELVVPEDADIASSNAKLTAPPALHHVPNQMRWDPFDLDDASDWIDGLHHVAGAGDPTMKSGVGILIYAAGRDMDAHTAFSSSDGDFLIVPESGVLDIQTELGRLLVRPNEVAVIPRGIRYRMTLPAGPVRGYVLELYEPHHFMLPELGPIGSNGLANARDFQAPTAAFDEDHGGAWWRLVVKHAHRMFAARQQQTPFDVVAWHGLYYPYKYDLGRFNVVGSTSFDHPDPSIYTVLTAASARPGTAIADFVIFPPRWLVAEDTFRPPWYHRNTMSEFMGLLSGDYDAKVGGGFRPAGASLHNVMASHGPDSDTHARASAADLMPHKVGVGSMAFMFESCLMLGVTEWGRTHCRKRQPDYQAHSWLPLQPHFKKPADGQEEAV